MPRKTIGFVFICFKIIMREKNLHTKIIELKINHILHKQQIAVFKLHAVL